MSIENVRCIKCERITLQAIVPFGNEIKKKCLSCGNIEIIKLKENSPSRKEGA